MKNMLRKKDIASVFKLTGAIKDLWIQELTADYLKKLSDSISRRLQMVIEAEGETIKY
jgi:hypothetical protein